MAKEEELKRVDLKVNVSCCDGCRRKVMKAMSLKGVLRTEIHPSLDRVTVVGNVDIKVLVKKLAKVGKIAEVAPPQEEQPKKREGDGGKDRDGGERQAPPPVGEKSKRKDEGKANTGDKVVPVAAAAATSYKNKDCHKCAQQHSAQGDAADHGKAPSTKDGAADHRKAPSTKDAAGDNGIVFEEEGYRFAGAKLSAADDVVAAHHHYYRAEPPSMAVPVQYMPYYAPANLTAPSYYAPASVPAPPAYYGGGGYYAMPPPVPPMPMPMPQQQMLIRPPPSRFDVDYFNEDNTVGCSVM